VQRSVSGSNPDRDAAQGRRLGNSHGGMHHTVTAATANH